MDNFADIVMNNALSYHDDMMAEQEVTMPFWAKSLESIPAASAMMGNYGRRGSNTILQGPRRTTFRRRQAAVRGGVLRQGFGNSVLRPFSRFRDTEHLTGRIGNYRPFFAADTANAIDRQLRGQAVSPLGQRLNRFGSMEARGTPLMTGGFYSRVSASAKIGLMSDARFSRTLQSGGLSNFLGQAYGSDVPLTPKNRGIAQRALLTSGSGRLTGSIGGYMSAFTEGAMDLRPGGGFANEAARRGFNRAATQAAELGIRGGTLTTRNIAGATRSTMARTVGKRATAGVAAKGVGLAAGRVGGMLIPGVNVLMTAWAVYDLAKLGMHGIGYGIKTTGQAYESFKGDTRTPIMGQKFNDSEAAITSRARGVQAIQNSRMNARSALGAEAGGLAAHYG